MNHFAIRSIVLMLLLPAVGSAGVYIETVSRDTATGKTTPSQKTYIQGGMARMESGDGDITIFKGDALYSLDKDSRRYRVMDKAAVEKMAAGLGTAMKNMQAQMQARMANMPPEQRAQMEQMMGRMVGAPGAKPNVYEAVDAGRNDTVASRGCRVWNIKRNGVIEDEFCVVPYSSLPGKEDVQSLMKKMGELFQSLEQAMPNAQPGRGMIQAYGRINGYPVRQRDVVNGKPSGDEELLKAWQEQSVPAAMFEIPAGYTREELPRAMGMPGKE